jgi:hypothetical protein
MRGTERNRHKALSLQYLSFPLLVGKLYYQPNGIHHALPESGIPERMLTRIAA